MEKLKGASSLKIKVPVDYYIVHGNKFTVFWRKLWHLTNKPVYYTKQKDLTAIAKFKTETIEQLGIVWFYETQGYQAAYLHGHSKCHVVLLTS